MGVDDAAGKRRRCLSFSEQRIRQGQQRGAAENLEDFVRRGLSPGALIT
jgi:hypothetical protein